MKFVHLKAVVGAIALSVAMAGTAHAQLVFESGINDPLGDVSIGESTVNGGPHVSGRVGIHVPNLSAGQYVDFQGLQGPFPPAAYTVTTVNNPTGTVTDHSRYGRFDFFKVDGQNLYVGEWSQTGVATDGDHTVYFAGTNATAAGSVPTSGTATYTVRGVSDYVNNGRLDGSFTANFGPGSTGTLTGSIQSATYKVDIGTAAISGGGFSGSGAVASNPSTSTTLATGGDVNGKFFGSSAQALAGIASFAGQRELDTAFGGAQ